jgi:hypothetical protein
MSEYNPIDEAKRIVDKARQNGIVLRVLGGLAVKYFCPSTNDRALNRECADMDLIGVNGHKVKETFRDLGYAADDFFNMTQGDARLLFLDPKERKVEIFLGIFDMCHKFDFRDRLTINDFAISISDLLMTKLQVVELTEKDIKDIIAMLLDYQIGHTDEGKTINAKYIADICSKKWGVYKTFTDTLKSTLTQLEKYRLGPQKEETVRSRIKQLLDEIESAPKSIGWKSRARIGERKIWYNLPEKPLVPIEVK